MKILPIVIIAFFLVSMALVFVKPSMATGFVAGLSTGLLAAILFVMAFFYILSGGR